MAIYHLSNITLRYHACPSPSPILRPLVTLASVRVAVATSCCLAPCRIPTKSIDRSLATSLYPSLFVALFLRTLDGRTDYPRHRSLPAYFPDPAAASARPTPRRPSPAPQSQVNTAASARRCVYQLSCLVPPSKLPNRRRRQPAAIFLRPAAAARPPPCTRRPITAVGFGWSYRYSISYKFL